MRILGENETVVQALRDEVNLKLEPLNPETKQRVRFYVGDVADNAYMAEAMGGADYVLYVPSLPSAFDCEVAPAECTITFLETVAGVIYTAFDCKVKKLVVAGPAPETLNFKLAAGVSPSMPAMSAALMETVVVAEARYLGPDSDTIICFARLDKDLKLETRNLKRIGTLFPRRRMAICCCKAQMASNVSPARTLR